MLLEEYPAAVEADFQAVYGLDVWDVYREKLDIWRASRLVTQLPPDGALGRASEGRGYTVTDHLLLSVLDRLDQAAWQRANAGKKRSQQSKPPQPLPRPGDKVKRHRMTAGKLLAFQRRTQPSQPVSKQA